MARKRLSTTEDYYKPFPTMLRKLMDETGKTQRDIAKALGVRQQAISQYADGSTSPTLERAALLAEYFGVSVDYLLGVTSIRSQDPDTRTICGRLGLTETVVKWLEEGFEREGPVRYAPFDSGLNSFLEHPRAFDFFMALAESDLEARRLVEKWDLYSTTERLIADKNHKFGLFLLKELALEIINELGGQALLSAQWSKEAEKKEGGNTDGDS